MYVMKCYEIYVKTNCVKEVYKLIPTSCSTADFVITEALQMY